MYINIKAAYRNMATNKGMFSAFADDDDEPQQQQVQKKTTQEKKPAQ
jgi:hypothetical protein